jgi:hypothetical protein
MLRDVHVVLALIALGILMNIKDVVPYILISTM